MVLTLGGGEQFQLYILSWGYPLIVHIDWKLRFRVDPQLVQETDTSCLDS
jgi:hypothetical protein